MRTGLVVRLVFDHVDGLAVHDGGPTLDDLDAMLFQQGAHAAGEPRDDAVFPAHGLADVDARALHMDAQRAVTHEVVGLVKGLGRVDHGLGWDAAHVQAGAAQLITFDQRGGDAQLRGAYRRDVAAGAAAYDQ
jgi:hypothetical protein